MTDSPTKAILVMMVHRSGAVVSLAVEHLPMEMSLEEYRVQIEKAFKMMVKDYKKLILKNVSYLDNFAISSRYNMIITSRNRSFRISKKEQTKNYKNPA